DMRLTAGEIILHNSLARKRSSGPLFGAFKEYGPLLGNRRFMVHVLLKGTALGVLFAYISSSPFIMQTIYGFSELKFGLFMGFNAIFAAVGSIMAVKFKILKRAAWIGGWVLLMATVVESLALFFIDDFWAYEMALLPMLFALGMIFTVGNTLAMNEGRQNAGAASAILGVTGYVFGAIVSPLVGLGDIRYSTAIVFLVMAVQVLLYAYGSRRIPADLDKN
ncbi:MAG: Bcr/CflA family drug resistance efflux transporter, partial [Muribaculaceae bacterium]|nr:Bcr/CflA family drug resistance efflux transporter [Muribaculaceae bacterium]